MTPSKYYNLLIVKVQLPSHLDVICLNQHKKLKFLACNRTIVVMFPLGETAGGWPKHLDPTYIYPNWTQLVCVPRYIARNRTLVVLSRSMSWKWRIHVVVIRPYSYNIVIMSKLVRINVEETPINSVTVVLISHRSRENLVVITNKCRTSFFINIFPSQLVVF